ncbi:hypothetical protein PghCCS26_50790 [Paenibacillus glycanilyticus]|uniref:Uncharacterized protein n=1 Tax=Paenibacillus glycanilyticus TaxID=126569 RepID=A0ABQ6NT21_9BACL|nr:hypothetical protein PghCCS26_50790 [Paenibacillus glycanilyticus]
MPTGAICKAVVKDGTLISNQKPLHYRSGFGLSLDSYFIRLKFVTCNELVC